MNKNLNNEINTRVNSDANLQSQINDVNVTANKFQAPDYGTKTSIQKYTSGNPFYAPADGYVMLDRVYNASECIMYVNWVEICRINGGNTVPGACFPVAKGDAICFSGMPSQYSDASYYYKR